MFRQPAAAAAEAEHLERISRISASVLHHISDLKDVSRLGKLRQLPSAVSRRLQYIEGYQHWSILFCYISLKKLNQLTSEHCVHVTSTMRPQISPKKQEYDRIDSANGTDLVAEESTRQNFSLTETGKFALQCGNIYRLSVFVNLNSGVLIWNFRVVKHCLHFRIYPFRYHLHIKSNVFKILDCAVAWVSVFVVPKSVKNALWLFVVYGGWYLSHIIFFWN